MYYFHIPLHFFSFFLAVSPLEEEDESLKKKKEGRKMK
jgi:hypothetical protein